MAPVGRLLLVFHAKWQNCGSCFQAGLNGMVDMDRETLSKKIGINIRKFRTQQFLSQEGLALDSGIHPAYLGRLERGEKCPNIDTLLKICDALDISVAKILDFEETANSNSATKQRLEEALNRLSPAKQKQLAEIVENIVDVIAGD